MSHRLSASLILFALTLLVVLKHAALGYCGCTESLYLSACDCEAAAAVEIERCHCGLSTSDNEESPCEGCEIDFCFDADDHLWQPVPQLGRVDKEIPTIGFAVEPFRFPGSEIRELPVPLPPPRACGLPLLLRAEVLRI